MAGTTVGELLVALGLDPTGLETGAVEAESTMGRLGSTISGFATGAVAAFAAIGVEQFFSDAISEAEKAQTSIALLTQSLKDNVAGWTGDMSAIDQAIQRNVQYGATATDTRNSLQVLIGATGDEQRALDAQSIALDLAAYKHISLDQATQALVQTEAGHARALATLGINTKAYSTLEERLAEVHKITAGAADALAQTESGQLAAAQASIANSMEDLGTHLLPLVSEGMKTVAQSIGLVADAANTAAGPLGTLDGWLKSIGDSQGLLALVPFIGQMNQLTDSEKAAIATAQQQSQADQATGAAMMTLNGQMLALSASYQQGKISEADYTQQADALQSQMDALSGGIQDLTGHVDESTRNLGTWTSTVDDGGGAADSTTISLNQMGDALGTAAGAAFKGDADFQTMDQTVIALGADALTAAQNVLTLAAAVTAATTASQIPINPNLPSGTADASARFSTGSGYGAPNPLGDSNLQQADKAFQQSEAYLKSLSKHHAAHHAAGTAAAVMAADIGNAWTSVKTAADSYFDEIHQANIQAINDEHAHAIAIAQTDYAQELLANHAKANAEKTALSQKQAGEQFQQLSRNVSQAQAQLALDQTPVAGETEQQKLDRQKRVNDDEWNLSQAQNALSDWQAQQQINKDDAAAAVADAASKKKLDTATKNADAKAKTDTTAENNRATAEKKAFDTQLSELERHLTASKAKWQVHQDAIIELLHAYGIKYKAAGNESAQMFADGLIDGFGTAVAVPSGKAPVATKGTAEAPKPPAHAMELLSETKAMRTDLAALLSLLRSAAATGVPVTLDPTALDAAWYTKAAQISSGLTNAPLITRGHPTGG